MPRLFTAIEPSVEAAEMLAGFWSDLPGAHWEQIFHITLTHFGEWPGPHDEILRSLETVEFQSFTLTPTILGFFGSSGKQQVMWHGIADSEELVSLHADHAEIRRRLVGEPEHLQFAPHLTLARVGRVDPEHLNAYLRSTHADRLEPLLAERVGATIEPNARGAEPIPSFDVRSFVLFESVSSNDGPRYRKIDTFGAG